MTSYRDDFRSAERHALWTLPRALVAAFVLIAAVFLLLVATTPLTIGFGWFRGEANLRSFEHVKQTYALAFDDAEAMRQVKANACLLRQERDREADPSAKQQRTSQLLAYETRYNSIKAEYDAYMEDHFRGRIIRPASLPYPFPALNLDRCAA